MLWKLRTAGLEDLIPLSGGLTLPEVLMSKWLGA